MGLFSSVVLIISWNLNNQPSKKEKGLAMMVMNVVGQCGPLIGVNLFPKHDGPHYVGGMLVSGCFMFGVVLLAAILRAKLAKMNDKTAGRGAYEMIDMPSAGLEGTALEEVEGLMADGQPTRLNLPKDRSFRYML